MWRAGLRRPAEWGRTSGRTGFQPVPARTDHGPDVRPGNVRARPALGQPAGPPAGDRPAGRRRVRRVRPAEAARPRAGPDRRCRDDLPGPRRRGRVMRTTLYLIRHAATPANLQTPAKLQGCRTNPDLHPVGVRQAAATRDFLAIRPIDFVYSSPLRRSLRTAEIIAEPHGLNPVAVEALTECDVGAWEGRSWEEIKAA